MCDNCTRPKPMTKEELDKRMSLLIKLFHAVRNDPHIKTVEVRMLITAIEDLAVEEVRGGR